MTRQPDASKSVQCGSENVFELKRLLQCGSLCVHTLSSVDTDGKVTNQVFDAIAHLAAHRRCANGAKEYSSTGH